MSWTHLVDGDDSHHDKEQPLSSTSPSFLYKQQRGMSVDSLTQHARLLQQQQQLQEEEDEEEEDEGLLPETKNTNKLSSRSQSSIVPVSSSFRDRRHTSGDIAPPSFRRSMTEVKERVTKGLKGITLGRSGTSAARNDFIGSFDYKLSSLERARIQQEFENELIDTLDKSKVFELKDCLEHVREGVQDIVQDDFSRCFMESVDTPWNWNLYLLVLWLLGIVVRYFLILPIRMLSLVIGFSIFFLVFSLVKLIPDRYVERRENWERALIRWACGLFVFSWTGVIRVHGVIPSHKPNRIYVANHTSLIDVVLLSQHETFSLVGQKHGGFIGFFQDRILKSIRCLWFDRSVAKDRSETARLIKAHIQDPRSNRLLVFPEGTCVNNNYCVQFKKGVFELGAEVCPIAIRYNPIFVNAFWNSRRVSFQRYLVTLMSSWSVVADVYYLAPMSIKNNETAIEFTARVKQKICDKARLINVNWDGYLKHFSPSARYVQARQKAMTQRLLNRLTPKERKALDALAAVPSEKIGSLIKNKSNANLKELQLQQQQANKKDD